MNAIVDQALHLWALEGADYTLVAARENHVFRVSKAGETYALRLHRPHYRSDAELLAELDWTQAVNNAGIITPAPVPSRHNRCLEHVDATQVDLLTWLSGTPMSQAEIADRPALFYTIGKDIARLHIASDAWTKPPTFTRCRWDHAGLLGDHPLWGRFWENPALSKAETAQFLAFRARASKALAHNAAALDTGLIHADLVPDNVLIADDTLHFIDFDDGGFGYRLFDIATPLLKQSTAPDYPQIRAAILAGYHSQRPLAADLLDLFIAIRAVTYVGWNITRITEDGARERNARFIATALRWTRHAMDATA